MDGQVSQQVSLKVAAWAIEWSVVVVERAKLLLMEVEMGFVDLFFST